MSTMDFSNKVTVASSGLPSMEYMLGKGLIQPFSNTNAGARKLMHSTHRDQVFPLMHGEKSIIETGFEIKFGDLSSSFTRADTDYKVLARVNKFEFYPGQHYYFIIQDINTGKLDVLERLSYHHVTESYGYLYNNDYIDSLTVGDTIHTGDVIRKSLAYDEYNNRTDGANFNVAYMALDSNMEDSVIFRKGAAEKLTASLVKPVMININENDIPLNLYGDDGIYKIFPDIGEEIENSILIALRKEKKDEALFMQSRERLKEFMLSDEKYSLHGYVVDINVYCNNPENLEGLYNNQIKSYYYQAKRMHKDILDIMASLNASPEMMSYNLQKLVAQSKRICNNTQWVDKKLFSNIMLEIVVVEEKKLEVGDKTSDRYGGKGVISKIIPDEEMLRFGNGEYIDVIKNSSTMYNRENPGQMFEISLTHIGFEILQYILKKKEEDPDNFSVDQALGLIHKYISLVSPNQAVYFSNILSKCTDTEKYMFLNSMIEEKAIHLSMLPISESMDIDKLKAIYDEFPFIKQTEVEVPLKKSDGTIRYIKTRRPMVIGTQYIFRLKQFAEEKFSATSLSSTNIRNQNAKSRANREYKELFSNTPIRFGNMESNDMNHIGSEHVVTNLLVHSTSPHARRLCEEMYIKDPFVVDIRPDNESKNRGAEIVFAYLKTAGKRLVFIKKAKKKRRPVLRCPIYYTNMPIRKPVFKVTQPVKDVNTFYKDRFTKQAKEGTDKRLRSPLKRYPFGKEMKERIEETMRKLEKGEER